MSSSVSKILEKRINVFKSNSEIMKNKKINIRKYQLYTNASKNNRWLLFVILKLSDFVWTLCSSAWGVSNNFLIIDATDRSKISNNQKRSFFAVSLYDTPFYFSQTFPLILQSLGNPHSVILNFELKYNSLYLMNYIPTWCVFKDSCKVLRVWHFNTFFIR